MAGVVPHAPLRAGCQSCAARCGNQWKSAPSEAAATGQRFRRAKSGSPAPRTLRCLRIPLVNNAADRANPVARQVAPRFEVRDADQSVGWPSQLSTDGLGSAATACCRSSMGRRPSILLTRRCGFSCACGGTNRRSAPRFWPELIIGFVIYLGEFPCPRNVFSCVACALAVLAIVALSVGTGVAASGSAKAAAPDCCVSGAACCANGGSACCLGGEKAVAAKACSAATTKSCCAAKAASKPAAPQAAAQSCCAGCATDCCGTSCAACCGDACEACCPQCCTAASSNCSARG